MLNLRDHARTAARMEIDSPARDGQAGVRSATSWICSAATRAAAERGAAARLASVQFGRDEVLLVLQARAWRTPGSSGTAFKERLEIAFAEHRAAEELCGW